MITIFAKPLSALRAAARVLAGLAAAGVLSMALVACGQAGSDAPPSTTVGGSGAAAPAAPPPQQQAEPLPGTWSGWLQFEGSNRADYSWTFRNDGTFVTSFGTYGTWTQNGPQVSWRFNDPPNTVYNGTLSNGRISGTMNNSSSKGVFEVARGAAAPAPQQQQQQAASLAGAWNGYWVVTGGEGGKRAGERLNVNWSFSQNGDFIDNSGKRVGSWSQSGNQIQFSFDNSTLFKGTINGNRVTGTFALPQGGGVYGDFELTR